MSAVAGFVVAWTQNDFDVTFKALGWAYPIAKASAGAIQVGLLPSVKTFQAVLSGSLANLNPFRSICNGVMYHNFWQGSWLGLDVPFCY